MKIKWKKTMGVKRYAVTLLLSLFTLVNIWAQKKDISGVVKEPSGVGAIAASVQVKGTTIGTVTDNNGNYSLSVPADAKTLVFKYYGMEDQEVAIKGNKIDVTFREDTKMLNDVVVIGYGTSNRRDLTGPIDHVDAKKLDVPVSSAAEALSGKLAGVQVTTTEGAPDADIKIRVRGGGSITGDNSPLYIVDGFPVSSISDLPPSTIKSIDVLKDASSTAIYGSQGANGVIIVTTKDPSDSYKNNDKSDAGKFSVNYNGYFGVKQIAKKLEVLSVSDYARWQYELEAVRGGTYIKDKFSKYFNQFNPSLDVYTPADYDQIMNYYDGLTGNNWQDKIFGQLGSTQNHSVSVMGGNKITNYNLSYNNVTDKAIMLGSDFKQDNLMFKLNSTPYKFLKVNFSAKYSDTRVNGSGANDVNSAEKSTSDSRLKHSVIYTPVPLKDYTIASDVDEEEVGNLYPPDVVIFDNWKQTRKLSYQYNGSVAATIFKGLVVKSELGMSTIKYDQERFYGPSSYWSRTVSYNANAYQKMGIVTMDNDNTYRFRNANTISYEKKNFIKGKKGHNLNVMVGEETVITTSNSLYTEAVGIPTYLTYQDAFAFTGTAQYFSQIKNYFDADEKMLSFFGRFNYDFKSKYLLSVTMRGDGSSKFATGHQWGFFPSVAGAWRISDEEFMSGVQSWMNSLKLRASMGEVGNNKIASGQYMINYSSGSASGYIPSYTNLVYSAGNLLPNPDLKWETTITRNIGIDYGFFRNRLSGSLDVYYNNTKDLLILIPLPGSGYTGQYKNIGSTQNIGAELTVNGVIVDKKNWGIDVSANISMNQGTVIALNEGRTEMFVRSDWAGSGLQNGDDYVVRVGQPVGMMYGYVTADDKRYATDDFKWTGTAWEMNDAKYTTSEQVTVNGQTFTVYKDVNGNTFVKNSALTSKSWGPGALKLKDLNGDGQITTADQQVIGNANPIASGGFTINARAYGFDLAANFNYVIGNNIYNANKIEFTTVGTDSYYGRNMTSEMKSGNRWVSVDPTTAQLTTDVTRLAELNANTTLWSPVMNGSVFHSWAVEDGSFLRLSSLTIGYTLPKKLLKKLYVQTLRFYVSASNLFCLTNYTGYDPEVDTRRSSPLTPGVDYSAYPKSQSVNIGVNIGF